MRLRTKFLLFVIILHVVTLVLSYFIFKDHVVFFIAAEILILISIFIAWQLYNEMIRPLQTLMTGADAIRDKDFNVKFVTTGKYEMDRLIMIYNQMVDHLREERTRQEQQHFFLEKLIQTSPTGILILDFDENVQHANPKVCTVLGVEVSHIINKPIAGIENPLMNEIRQLRSGEAKTVSINGVQTFKLQRSHFIDRGFPRSFIMIEELTADILAAEKKAYGKVIRMMAHEVNNTIGPVNSILESTLKTNNLWQDQNEALKNALQVALQRNQNLNIFMRNFAEVVRLPEPKRKRVDLNKIVENIVTLMKLSAGEKEIQFIISLDKNPVYINADEQQFEQALINIIKNAIEAIDRSGVIDITTVNHPERLIISDTGSGVSNNSENLFTPFFSTKKDGQGIGLTLVKEILLNHQCRFSLKTLQPGKTVFDIEFI